MAKLRILYRDRDLLVIHKPSGMKTYRDSKSERTLSAQDILQKQFAESQIYPVHRLDQGTCGVLLFAFRPDIANLLQKAFREGKVKKTYWALAWGDPPHRGEWKMPLPSKEEGAQRALTKFRTLGRFETEPVTEHGAGKKFCWIECEPKTGRNHQIRRHASMAGYPLVGDAEYSDANSLKNSEVFGMRRIALSAIRLELKHPTRRIPISIETYPETGFGKILKQLESSR